MLKKILFCLIGTFLTMNAIDVKIPTIRGEVILPKNPKKVAVFDLGILDNLFALGVKVSGTIDRLYLPYLEDKARGIPRIGTMFEPNYEALHSMNLDLIILSTISSSKYDEINKIAKTIDLSSKNTDLIAYGINNLKILGLLFGKEKEANKLIQDIENLHLEVKNIAKGKGKVLMIMVSGGKLSVFGKESILGWSYKALDLEVVDKTIEKNNQGQVASFEYVKKNNPDILIVLDRTSAIGQSGQNAKTILNNDLIKTTNAWKNNHIIYLSSGSYVSLGGYHQLMTDLNKLKEGLSK